MPQSSLLGTKSHDYQHLSQSINGVDIESKPQDGTFNSPSSWNLRRLSDNTRTRLCVALACMCIIAVLSAASVLVFQATSHANHLFDARQSYICGNSTREARAAGCTFDQLMWAWYPPHCPHYANDEYLATDEWRFFSDPWGTEATAPEWEKAMNNNMQLYSRHGEHLTHCLFLFLSVGQVLRDGTAATPKLRDYSHLHHCVKMLLPIVQAHENYTLINTKTPTVSYREYC